MVAMAKARLRKQPSRIVRWRPWFQAGFLLVWLDPLLLRMHQVCGPVFHCYACPLATFACPIGVIANFSALHVVPYMAIGTLVVVGALVAGFICGWVCPFGFLQDLLDKVPLPKVRLPLWTGYTRYLVLAALVLVVPFLWGESHPLFICRVCPAGALEGGVGQTVKGWITGGPASPVSLTKWVILGAFLAAAVFIYRPWCTLLCPLGAVLGLFNRASIVFLRVDDKKCHACGACGAMCKIGLAPEKQLKDPLCIRCMACTRCDAVGVSSVLARRRSGDAPEESGS